MLTMLLVELLLLLLLLSFATTANVEESFELAVSLRMLAKWCEGVDVGVGGCCGCCCCCCIGSD